MKSCQCYKEKRKHWKDTRCFLHGLASHIHSGNHISLRTLSARSSDHDAFRCRKMDHRRASRGGGGKEWTWCAFNEALNLHCSRLPSELGLLSSINARYAHSPFGCAPASYIHLGENHHSCNTHIRRATHQGVYTHT